MRQEGLRYGYDAGRGAPSGTDATPLDVSEIRTECELSQSRPGRVDPHGGCAYIMHMSNVNRTSASARRARRATNVSLDSEHLAEARELGINVSQACERGLVQTIAEARAERWLEENRDAIESYSRYVEERGLPLEGLRLF